MTEKELMQSGLPYSAVDLQLLRELNATKDVIHRYNALMPSQTEELLSILKNLTDSAKKPVEQATLPPI